ncbi:MAG: septum formation initiator family protein [Muribaculaceae bacterium]|nr:septum formation initiator family protein [Muribaculaceae bacterium]MDE6574590.1 septum formation initiator family protein [Muribaculaceae bacterium]
MNPHLSSFISWVRRFISPGTLVCIVVICYIVFTGENTVFSSIDYDNTIDSLRRELAAKRDTMEYYRALNQRLGTDPDLMEQVVREQYAMKRTSEDVFIFAEN